MGVGVSVASVALGASVIEKHFTLSRADGGVDSAFSMEPAEMERLVHESEQAWRALGQVAYGPTQAERKSLQYRRTLYVVRDMQAGELFSPDNVRAIRPGLGLPTKYLETVLGRSARTAIRRGTALSFEYF
jgi:N-acetylneuraminate synthase